MGGQQLTIILLLLVPVPIAVLLLAHLNKRRAPVDLPLALLVISGGIWCGFYALELAMPSYGEKLIVGKIQYFAFVLAPLGWFLLGMELQGWMSKIGRKGIFLLSIMPLTTLGMVFTSDFHDFFWRNKELVEFNGLTLFRNDYGPGFWMHVVYSYSLNLIGVILGLTSLTRSNAFYTRQRIAITVAMVAPWISNMAYIFRLTDYAIDFTPFVFIGSSLILVFGVFRFRFGDLVPVARERIIAEMHDAILVLDDQMRIVDFNRALQELFPTRTRIIGVDLAILLEGHPKLRVQLQRQQENTSLMYTGFNDRVHRVTTELIPVSQGEPARLIVLRDLSADSRVQDALRLMIEGTATDVGEDFYRSLTRSLALVLDTKFAMVAVTDSGDEGKAHTLAFWDESDHGENFTYDVAGSPCEIAMMGGTCAFPNKVTEKFPDDKGLVEMGVESYLGTPLYSHDGKPMGVLAVMDVKPLEAAEIGTTVLEIFGMRAATEIERRRNEVRIEASERGYRQIVETTRDGVCVVDKEGVVEFVNEPMAALLGLTTEDLVSNVFVEKFSTEKEVMLEIARQENSKLEFSLLNARRDTKSIAGSKTVITDAEGVNTGMLYMFSDYTEQKLLQETNKGIEEQLRHAQKLESLGVLAGGVAHDFNNLLMPIIGYIELIRQRSSADSVVSDYLERIELAGEKLADLCNQMLTYSGKGHFVTSIVDINEITIELKGLVRASIPNNITLTYRLEDNLLPVKADATQLHQVMMNLIINAGEATGQLEAAEVKVSTGQMFLDGEPQESLHIGERLEPGEYVYFEVEDHGVGISTDDQEKLFEPFFTTKFTGRGLGMAVVFGIVRTHGGAIEVISELGSGTRIRVFFPITTEKRIVSTSSEAGGSGEIIRHRGKVLVVDDESFVREIFRGMLETLGFDVIEAEDGEQGLQRYSSSKMDLIACVIDLTMPGMSGDELASGIRRQDPDLPIMLVSGYSQKDVRSGLLSTSNVMFLQKPFTLAKFSSVLNEQLESKASPRNVY